MQTKTERHQPLTETEARAAQPIGFSVSPEMPDEHGDVALVVVIPSRRARVRVVQVRMEDVFETTACWVEGGEEVAYESDEAEEALADLVNRAGAEHARISQSEATCAAVLDSLRGSAPVVDFGSPASEHEHMIPVIFDVVATNRRAAAHVVADALALTEGSGLRLAFDRVNYSASHLLEAWWFPEAEDKPVDRNDRPEMWLYDGRKEDVRADECEQISRLLQEQTGKVPEGLIESLTTVLDERADRLREGDHPVV